MSMCYQHPIQILAELEDVEKTSMRSLERLGATRQSENVFKRFDNLLVPPFQVDYRLSLKCLVLLDELLAQAPINSSRKSVRNEIIRITRYPQKRAKSLQ